MRTFGLILLAFLAGVLLLVAALSWQGREAREYGRAAVQAAGGQGSASAVSYTLACADLIGRPLPGTVQKCEVEVRDGQAGAVLTLEGGRVFRVTR